MARYLIFNNLTEFNSVNAQLNAVFGYPNEVTKTNTYAAPISHPSNGRKAMVITDEALPHLTAPQQAAIVNSLSSDWTPPHPLAHLLGG